MTIGFKAIVFEAHATNAVNNCSHFSTKRAQCFRLSTKWLSAKAPYPPSTAFCPRQLPRRAAHHCCHIERGAYLKDLYSNLCHTSISNS